MPQVKPEVFVNAPPFYSITQISNLQILLFASIKTENLNGIDCYKIELFGGDETWISKESFMPVKYLHNNTEYTYSIVQNNVQESNVIFSDKENFEKTN